MNVNDMITLEHNLQTTRGAERNYQSPVGGKGLVILQKSLT